MKFEKAVKNLLSPAGVSINGDHPWDIRVKSKANRLYDRTLPTYSSIRFGLLPNDSIPVGVLISVGMLSSLQNHLSPAVTGIRISLRRMNHGVKGAL